MTEKELIKKSIEKHMGSDVRDLSAKEILGGSVARSVKLKRNHFGSAAAAAAVIAVVVIGSLFAKIPQTPPNDTAPSAVDSTSSAQTEITGYSKKMVEFMSEAFRYNTNYVSYLKYGEEKVTSDISHVEKYEYDEEQTENHSAAGVIFQTFSEASVYDSVEYTYYDYITFNSSFGDFGTIEVEDRSTGESFMYSAKCDNGRYYCAVCFASLNDVTAQAKSIFGGAIYFYNTAVFEMPVEDICLFTSDISVIDNNSYETGYIDLGNFVSDHYMNPIFMLDELYDGNVEFSDVDGMVNHTVKAVKEEDGILFNYYMTYIGDDTENKFEHIVSGNLFDVVVSENKSGATEFRTPAEQAVAEVSLTYGQTFIYSVKVECDPKNVNCVVLDMDYNCKKVSDDKVIDEGNAQHIDVNII